MKVKLSVDTYMKIWNQILEKTNQSRDKFLFKEYGLERIEKPWGKYFICAWKNEYLSSNLKVKDKKRWFLAKIKHGL